MSTRNTPSATEELNFKIYLILTNTDNHLWLVLTVLDKEGSQTMKLTHSMRLLAVGGHRMMAISKLQWVPYVNPLHSRKQVSKDCWNFCAWSGALRRCPCFRYTRVEARLMTPPTSPFTNFNKSQRNPSTMLTLSPGTRFNKCFLTRLCRL